MPNNFGLKLEKLRQGRQLKRREVAAMLGINETTYAAYEECRCTPDPDRINLLCVFFNVSFEQLMGYPSCPTYLVNLHQKI